MTPDTYVPTIIVNSGVTVPVAFTLRAIGPIVADAVSYRTVARLSTDHQMPADAARSATTIAPIIQRRFVDRFCANDSGAGRSPDGSGTSLRVSLFSVGLGAELIVHTTTVMRASNIAVKRLRLLIDIKPLNRGCPLLHREDAEERQGRHDARVDPHQAMLRGGMVTIIA